MGLRIGIDIGGTFTDLVFLDETGEVSTRKVLSTPEDYSQGIVNGLSSDRTVDPGDIAQLMHGTTVATNAILEGKGARVGLITTLGFRDVLEIRRLRMPALYDIRWRKPPPLVPRRLRLEVPERINAKGEIERPLDETAAAEAVGKLLAAGVDAIAVCLLNAYANGAHEGRIRDLIGARDAAMPVTLSSELIPEIKEYERTSTAVVNSYVLPTVRRYLRRLKDELAARRIMTPLGIMQSNGGVILAESAAERPFSIIESGPAAGVVGAAELARVTGEEKVLTFDMGGTTAKAALVENGRFTRVSSLDVGGGINVAGRLLKGGGYHVSAPAIDIAEVGSGGGSIVRLDAAGGLRVGPDSAGSVPGPACYGRGGSEPTVTDANVVLGVINPEGLAGGSLPINPALAARALEGVGRSLDLPLEEVAWGVHRVANAIMARALRAVSTERGLDPRAFSLMAFGGNGPVHAATLARALQIRRILVPPVPGVFSSLGMLFPDVEHHYVRTDKRPLTPEHMPAMQAQIEKLKSDGATALERDGFARADHLFSRFVELRYAAANAELTVAMSGTESAEELRRSFEDAHERQYGYRSPEEHVEIVNVRLIARGASASLVPRTLRLAAPAARPDRSRRVYLGPEAGWTTTPIVGRFDISGNWSPGPLLIEEYDSTTVVPPGARVRRIAWETLEIELG